MKKIVCTLLVALIFRMLPSVMAEQIIDADVSYNISDNTFDVSGSFPGETRGNITVGLKISDESESLIYVETSTAYRSDGSVEFEFDNIPVKGSMPSGTYRFNFSSFLGYTDIYVEYMNISDKLELMQRLENASSSEMITLLRENADYLGINISDYENLSSASKGKFISVLCENVYNANELSIDTDEGLRETVNVLSQFVNDYINKTIVFKFNDCATAPKVIELCKDQEAVLLLDNDYNETAYDERLIYDMYTDSNLQALAAEQLVKINSAETIEDIREAFYEKILCAALSQAHVSKIDSLLNLYKTAFGIDLTDYQSLKSKDSVRNGIIGQNLFTYTEVADKFNKLVSEEKSYESKNSGSGGGGGGGSVSHPVSPTSSYIVGAETSSVPYVFNDIESALWAKEAILSLYNKNILSGRGDDSFEPNANITRAEFIKILIASMGIDFVVSDGFKDVDNEKWYSKYVYTAKANMWINGDADNNFKPEDYITREDITVILYRAYKITADIDPSGFSDLSSVSDYAKRAVGYYSHIGVINGFVDGTFSPKAFATRAQVAKIIYGLQ